MKEYQLRNRNYKIRYNDFPGEQTPIIFIHGLGCAGSFDYVEIAANKKFLGYRKILIDLLGAGYSDKPLDFVYNVKNHAQYLSEFLEDLNLDKVILFGHSLGGAISIELCSLCQEKVEKLILTEPNLDPAKKGRSSWAVAQYTEEDYKKRLKGLIELCESGRNTMWAATLRNWLPEAAYQISKDAVSDREVSWRKLFYSFPIPKYFIFGEKTLPNDDLEELPKNGIVVKTVSNAGHSMAWDNPIGLVEVISSCLE
ncbi:alpha/beta hydrolase [Gemella sp. ND 6198]|uniref:alpha/beta fold hydrolase n=1 Tax=Gemella sp. ND 6198 TaxID=2040624 RepID=UPI000E0A3D06|nr:alpha/beta hydrolase [Gemella sp. ND 6198]AXI25973.1 alpha/beta hydrolase [Gemella sp. ND 6198]